MWKIESRRFLYQKRTLRSDEEHFQLVFDTMNKLEMSDDFYFLLQKFDEKVKHQNSQEHFSSPRHLNE